jgi:hypothetical protein
MTSITPEDRELLLRTMRREKLPNYNVADFPDEQPQNCLRLAHALDAVLQESDLVHVTAPLFNACQLPAALTWRDFVVNYFTMMPFYKAETKARIMITGQALLYPNNANVTVYVPYELEYHGKEVRDHFKSLVNFQSRDSVAKSMKPNSITNTETGFLCQIDNRQVDVKMRKHQTVVDILRELGPYGMYFDGHTVNMTNVCWYYLHNNLAIMEVYATIPSA